MIIPSCLFFICFCFFLFPLFFFFPSVLFLDLFFFLTMVAILTQQPVPSSFDPFPIWCAFCLLRLFSGLRRWGASCSILLHCFRLAWTSPFFVFVIITCLKATNFGRKEEKPSCALSCGYVVSHVAHSYPGISIHPSLSNFYGLDIHPTTPVDTTIIIWRDTWCLRDMPRFSAMGSVRFSTDYVD